MESEREVRAARRAAMQAAGVEPYVPVSERTHSTAEVLASFAALEASGQAIVLAGRAVAVRRIGALTFIRLQDGAGQLQVVLRAEETADYEQWLGWLDVGDIVEAQGRAFVTKTGEQSLLASNFKILSKALNPLPEKWHGLSDIELRYRHREQDLIVNPEARAKLITRSRLVSSLRRFLDDQTFLEIETPVLQALPGGANARPFVTHHNALDAQFYLRIATELHLKRLVVGGLEKIYEIGRLFRNEGIDHSHNPEFTSLELYWAYPPAKADFIAFLEQMVMAAIKDVPGQQLSVSAPWPQITFRDAVLQATGLDIESLTSLDELKQALKEHKLKVNLKSAVGLGEALDELYKQTARAAMVNPTWVLDYPVDLKPLARAVPGAPKYSASAQLIIQGQEVVNAYYYELTDPVEQRRRFMEQEALREQGSEVAQYLDEDFLLALETAMPPTAGVGLGIDRLAALVTNSPNLKEVIAFPTLKPLL